MMHSIQIVIMWGGIAALAVLAAWPVLTFVGRSIRRLYRLMRGLNLFEAICSVSAICFLCVFAAEKHVVPTVKGITLGFPMETPTSVSLAWSADEGQSIHSNDNVKVYWRDAELNSAWMLALEGFGITNACVSGFFIDRNTDWMVVVEPHQEEEATTEEAP